MKDDKMRRGSSEKISVILAVLMISVNEKYERRVRHALPHSIGGRACQETVGSCERHDSSALRSQGSIRQTAIGFSGRSMKNDLKRWNLKWEALCETQAAISGSGLSASRPWGLRRMRRNSARTTGPRKRKPVTHDAKARNLTMGNTSTSGGDWSWHVH